MEQANEILEYLRDVASHVEAAAVANDDDGKDNNKEDKLGLWNDRIEDLIFGSMEEQLVALPKSFTESEYQVLVTVSKELHRHFLETLLPTASDDGDVNVDVKIDNMIKSCHIDVLSRERRRFYQLIRAVRNWMRFYLQIYPILEASRLSTDGLVGVFQQTYMLKLYLHLAEHLLPEQPVLARYAALILFYAAFYPVPSVNTRRVMQFLVQDLDMPKRVLHLYLRTDSIAFVLALTQNIHNLVGSAPEAVSTIQSVRVGADETSSSCPWVPSGENQVSYRAVWDRLLEFCLTDHSLSDFPGDKEDYRAELVGEILRTLFAIRIGSNLTTSEQRLVPLIFQLDMSDPRSVECQRSVMTLLTEADASVAIILANESMEALLKLLELQIDTVVTTSRIDDAAAASLTPILVIFYRFCQLDANFLQQTRQTVFPNGTVPNNTVDNNSTNYMLPADAPDGTLRHKLIRLLTWPQGYIKRFAAEILWQLCHSNPQEFGRSVGMGNALPFLAAKGFAQMPSGVIQ